jgi:hypothetical protein
MWRWPVTEPIVQGFSRNDDGDLRVHVNSGYSVLREFIETELSGGNFEEVRLLVEAALAGGRPDDATFNVYSIQVDRNEATIEFLYDDSRRIVLPTQEFAAIIDQYKRFIG